MFLNDHGAKRGRFDHSAAPAYGSYGGGGGASTSYGGYSGGGGGRGDMPPCNTLFIGNLSDQVRSPWFGHRLVVEDGTAHYSAIFAKLAIP